MTDTTRVTGRMTADTITRKKIEWAAADVAEALRNEYPDAIVRTTFGTSPWSGERGIRVNYYDPNDPNQNYSYHYDWSPVTERHPVIVEAFDDFSFFVSLEANRANIRYVSPLTRLPDPTRFIQKPKGEENGHG